MDAFAVAIGKGLSMKRINWKHATIIALYFGAFQALMPLLGYLIAFSFASHVKQFSHIIAFALLALIGAKMIWDAMHESSEPSASNPTQHTPSTQNMPAAQPAQLTSSVSNKQLAQLTNSTPATQHAQPTPAKQAQNETQRLDHKELFMLAIATSIDALSVGISIALSEGDIAVNAGIIGITTFIISFLGVIVGNFFGARYKKGATVVGGVVLILIGVKIFLEHYGFSLGNLFLATLLR